MADGGVRRRVLAVPRRTRDDLRGDRQDPGVLVRHAAEVACAPLIPQVEVLVHLREPVEDEQAQRVLVPALAQVLGDGLRGGLVDVLDPLAQVVNGFLASCAVELPPPRRRRRDIAPLPLLLRQQALDETAQCLDPGLVLFPLPLGSGLIAGQLGDQPAVLVEQCGERLIGALPSCPAVSGGCHRAPPHGSLGPSSAPAPGRRPLPLSAWPLPGAWPLRDWGTPCPLMPCPLSQVPVPARWAPGPAGVGSSSGARSPSATPKSSPSAETGTVGSMSGRPASSASPCMAEASDGTTTSRGSS